MPQQDFDGQLRATDHLQHRLCRLGIDRKQRLDVYRRPLFVQTDTLALDCLMVVELSWFAAC